MPVIEFDQGTVTLRGPEEAIRSLGISSLVHDRRVGLWRAPAMAWRAIVEALRACGLEVDERASRFEAVPLEPLLEREPFPYQVEAVEAWERAGRRGVVVLPTGAGKTYVAQMAMQRLGRSTLVVTPTIDLLQQWYGVLGAGFDTEVGLLGGGHYEPRPITVTTYDSAYLHVERLGDRFELVVFDECHHLPGPSFRQAAEGCLSPCRLGLSATPERGDGGHYWLPRLIGPVVYRKEIPSLSGRFLAEYETVRLRVRLGDAERARYEAARARYLDFLRRHQVAVGSPGGWGRFLALTSRSEEGRRALFAYREQKKIAQAAPAKLRLLSRLLDAHAGDRVLVFAADNATVYRISRRFLVPAITHRSKVKERHEILERFRAGTYPTIVTSRVLNEGVDVPEANVAVVLSGSGSVREHVQRLGRILRRREGKRALLYEVVAEGTSEESTSRRRRQHRAYR